MLNISGHHPDLLLILSDLMCGVFTSAVLMTFTMSGIGGHRCQCMCASKILTSLPITNSYKFIALNDSGFHLFPPKTILEKSQFKLTYCTVHAHSDDSRSFNPSRTSRCKMINTPATNGKWDIKHKNPTILTPWSEHKKRPCIISFTSWPRIHDCSQVPLTLKSLKFSSLASPTLYVRHPCPAKQGFCSGAVHFIIMYMFMC